MQKTLREPSHILAKKIRESKNIITVKFRKKDGSLRTLNGRMDVVKHLKGGKSTLDSDKYITIFDMQAGGYRAINVDTIEEVKGV